jgi:hypothetical protein
MAGYSKTPLWKKLGLRAGDKLLLIDPASGWRVPDLPEGATSASEATAEHDASPAEVLIAFFSERRQLRELIPALAQRIFPAGAIWIAWPRRAAGHDSDIREHDIRAAALPLGLVDVKVAALDQDWSGLRLVWRVERRQASQATPG